MIKKELPSLSNFRDLSEIVNSKTPVLKENLLFRSEALRNIPDIDVQTLLDKKIKVIVDFRMEDEIDKNPNQSDFGATYIILSPIAPIAKLAASSGSDVIRIEDFMKQYHAAPEDILKNQMRALVEEDNAIEIFRSFLALLADDSNLPLVFHCHGGKDRTGYAALLILLILGIDLETIIKDYMYTNEANKEKNLEKTERYRKKYTDNTIFNVRKELILAKREYINESIDAMIEMAGSTENYIRNVLRISDAMQDEIRKNLLIQRF